jgi:hypothetical protein
MFSPSIVVLSLHCVVPPPASLPSWKQQWILELHAACTVGEFGVLWAASSPLHLKWLLGCPQGSLCLTQHLRAHHLHAGYLDLRCPCQCMVGTGITASRACTWSQHLELLLQVAVLGERVPCQAAVVLLYYACQSQHLWLNAFYSVLAMVVPMLGAMAEFCYVSFHGWKVPVECNRATGCGCCGC